MPPRRRSSKKKVRTLTEIRDATRDAYYEAAEQLGYPLRRAGVNESIYVDDGNWLVPGGVLINHEYGSIPSLDYEFGWQLMEKATDILAKKLGRGYYIDGLNAALDAVVAPDHPWDYKGF